jgi:YjbE family integral membrane protein
MEIFSAEFFSALVANIIIDLVLAGDNAIVIALAARALPPDLRKRAVLWGTVGAVAVRTALTMVVVWLLKIPGLLAIGGVLLVWIACKLLVDADDSKAQHVDASQSFWAAMKTIVVADALMGLDNVLAVAGAAQGSFLLVVLGLLISIPIMIWGSHIILIYVERYPVIVYIGSGVLAWTAVKMVTSEPLLDAVFDSYPAATFAAYALVIIGVLGSGFLLNHRKVHARVVGHVVDFSIEPETNSSMPSGATPGKILIPVDASPNSLKAVQHAVLRHLAFFERPEVHLLHVRGPLSSYVARFVSRGDIEAYHRQEAEKALAPARALLRRCNVPHAEHVATGDRVGMINEMAERLGVSEIVVGTARKNSLTRILQDSVSHELLDTSPVPVRIVVGDTTSRLERFAVPASICVLLLALLVVSE